MYYFRVVAEGEEWLCKRGTRVLYRFASVIDAVDRAEVEAAANAPSEVIYHDLGGAVTVVAVYPSTAQDPAL